MTFVRRGFALPAAMWMIAAFAATALHFGIVARTQRLAVNRSTERLLARVAAEAAFRGLLAELGVESDGTAVDPWRRYHGRTSTSRGSDSVLVTLRTVDAGALLYPAGMSKERLVGFFRAIEADTGLADSTARHVQRLARGDGPVEIAGCPGAGWLGLAQHDSLMARVLDRAAVLMSCIGSMSTNVQTAPAAVLAALPGMRPAAVQALLQRRDAGQLGNILDISGDLRGVDRDDFMAAVPALLGNTATGTAGLLVRVEAHTDGAAPTAVLEAVLVRHGTGTTISWMRLL